MSDDKFQDKYRIDSARAWWHDYDGGAYFITICTENREHFFGEIEGGVMVLSARFHDRIIRDLPEMNRIATYIQNNVVNWRDDEFYTPRK